MRNNTLVMLGASIAFGALAVLLARSWISGAVEREFSDPQAPLAGLVMPSRSAPAAIPTTPVLVAAHDIAFGDTLTPDSFDVVDFPEDSVPLDTFTSAAELFGAPDAVDAARPLRALRDIKALEPVFADRVSGPGARASLSARIGEGLVATSLSVDPVTGVGGHVVPGDLVDVLLSTQPEPKTKPDLYVSSIIVQAVRVLGVDQNASLATEDASLARTVTVEVDRRDLQVLTLAARSGTLSLALREAGASDFVVTAGLRSDEIGRPARRAAPRTARTGTTAAAPAPQPRPAAPPRANVKVVRGDTVKSVRVRRERDVQSADASQTELAGGPQP